MASFKAINIESDDESDDEVDNTKEIQIEDALKLYQTALKYHSQDDTLPQADDAYRDLFKSEIFSFPESQSDFARFGSLDDYQDDEVPPWLDPQEAMLATQTTADSAQGTLPQVLHLSYKNRGEFHLDNLRAYIQEKSQQGLSDQREDCETKKRLLEDCLKALDDFAEALDKDESDVDLWRRASRVSQALGSVRAERFCLEAALDSDEDDTDGILGLRNAEARFDISQLVSLKERIQDELSLSRSSLSRKKVLSLPRALKTQLIMYPFLPNDRPAVEGDPAEENQHEETLLVQEHSMDAIGSTLLGRLKTETDIQVAKNSGSVIRLRLPPQEPQILHEKDASVSNAIDPLRDQPKTSGPQHAEVAESEAVVAGSGKLDDRRGSKTSEKDGLESPTTPFPLRKRSADTADLPENADGERSRSKRIRNRQSNAFERDPVEPSVADKLSGQDQKIKVCIHADRWVFDHVRALTKKVGVTDLSSSDDVRRLVMPEGSSKRINDGDIVPLRQAIQDFYSTMQSWNTRKTQGFLRHKDDTDTAIDTSNTGLHAFLEQSNQASSAPVRPIALHVQQFVDYINQNNMTAEMAAIVWIHVMLSKSCAVKFSTAPEMVSSPVYVSRIWCESLKTTVVQLIESLDDHLFEMLDHLGTPENEGLSYIVSENESQTWGASKAEVAQSIFELHLDIYSRITNPASEVDEETKFLERGRLYKWARAARDIFACYAEDSQREGEMDTSLFLRYLWATVFQLKAVGAVSRERVITFIEDLKNEVSLSSLDAVSLPNNAEMPVISVEAAEQEISKLETMDFFISIFRKSDQHPVDLIEKLEPVLMPSNANLDRLGYQRRKRSDGNETVASGETTLSPASDGVSNLAHAGQRILQEFVANASSSLRMSLWSRLRKAYEDIDFYPKVLLINAQILGLLLDELQNPQYLNAPQDEREQKLLTLLHELDVLIRQTHEIVENRSDALACLDDENIRKLLSGLSYTWTLLYAVSLYDDYSQVIQKSPPLTNPFRAYPSESFHPASIRFHEMQLRSIILMYQVLQEAMSRNPDRFPEAFRQRNEFLSYVHYSLGMRRLCKASDNLFLKFMGKQLRELAAHGRIVSEDLAQILYDLYDLHLFSTPTERQDHGCEADYLDRATALDLVDLVLERARNVNMKDMHKLELGRTVEKLQNALGAVKYTNNTTRNRRIYNAFIKSPIDRAGTFQCLRGMTSISSIAVDPEEVPIASSGWYLLVPQINLAKYRRTEGQPTSGAGEDLQAAVTFLIHDLEYDMERWETWLYLATAHDFLTDESVLWSAEKINTGRHELAQTQRAAIHAYTMAVAAGIRNAEPGEETSTKFADLFTDFGVRVYSSARPPFNMDAFAVEDKIQCRITETGEVYTQKNSRGLSVDQASQFAAVLFRKALKLRDSNWVTHYMLGKCLWKLYFLPNIHDDQRAQLISETLRSFHNAVDRLPQRKDPARQEPVLEPIYKVIFVIHKLVEREEMTVESGCETLTKLMQQQNQFEIAKTPSLSEDETWNDFVLELLKILRACDKSKWHHRIVFNIAKILYEKHGQSHEAAKISKDYLIDQHMFSTKTLALTVWKPRNERAGRHWIYMTRYAMFISQLLEQTDDVEAMRTLARRVRKKTNEFYEHQGLWEFVCDCHLKLHRRVGEVAPHNEDGAFKNMTREVFDPRAALVDAWCQSPSSSHPLLDILREVSELKKMNGSLIKYPIFDDLLADTYAAIFTQIGPTLGESLAPAPSRDKAVTPTPRAGTPTTSNATPIPDKPDKMALNTLMNMDGSEDSKNSVFTGARPQMILGSSLPPTEAPVKSRVAARLVARRDVIKHVTDASANRGATSGSGGATSTKAGGPQDKRARKPSMGKEAGQASSRSHASGEKGDRKHSDGQPHSGQENKESDALEGNQDQDNDADSELSEADPEPDRQLTTPKRTMFPNLRTGVEDSTVKIEDDEEPMGLSQSKNEVEGSKDEAQAKDDDGQSNVENEEHPSANASTGSGVEDVAGDNMTLD